MEKIRLLVTNRNSRSGVSRTRLSIVHPPCGWRCVGSDARLSVRSTAGYECDGGCGRLAAVRIVPAAIVLMISAGVAWLSAGALDIRLLLRFAGTAVGIGLIGYLVYIALGIKFATDLPGFDTLHLTSFKMAFFDRSLNRNVRYACHALAIDEMRADFDRVGWVNDGDTPNREIDEGARFEQYWFAGNHSDIGGSYAENESRLSDLAIGWMSTEAKRAGLIINEDLLTHCSDDQTGLSTMNTALAFHSSAGDSSGARSLVRWLITPQFIGP